MNNDGHRKRLIRKFNSSYLCDFKNIFDYELLEILLFFVNSRKDTKSISKKLFKRFKNFSSLLAANTNELSEIDGVGDKTILLFKVINVIFSRMLEEPLRRKIKLNSLRGVIEYSKAKMQHLKTEELRIFFLNKGNYLMMDEVMQRGDVDNVQIIIRNILAKAIILGATAIILVHNHPSGNAEPSLEDIRVTNKLADIAAHLSIKILDHVIISENSYTSMKEKGIL